MLVPRYQDFNTNYTSLFHAPKPILKFEEHDMPRVMKPSWNLVCLELKGHPYPPLAYSNTKPNKKSIHNILLMEAKRDLENCWMVLSDEQNKLKKPHFMPYYFTYSRVRQPYDIHWRVDPHAECRRIQSLHMPWQTTINSHNYNTLNSGLTRIPTPCLHEPHQFILW